MNQLAANNERLPMDSVGISSGSTGAKIAPQNLAEVVKFAEVMCRADIALPKHLRGNAGACMAVALQAMEWELSPFAVASKSYTVNGAIAYEAQLIAAVVNTRSGIKGRLKYRYDGTGNEMTCTVTGVLDGDECEYTTPPIGAITPKNSPLWKTDPQQQLGYFAARSWARRHCPEVILGVYDRDEAEQFRGPENAKDVTPQPSVMQRLRAAQASREVTDEQEGFDASFVHSETETALNGEILTDNTESGSSPSSEPVNAEASPLTSAASDDGESSPLLSDAPYYEWLLNIARMLWGATNVGGDLAVLRNQKVAAIASHPKPDGCPDIFSKNAESIFACCRQIVDATLEKEDGLAMIAGIIGCDQDDIEVSA